MVMLFGDKRRSDSLREGSPMVSIAKGPAENGIRGFQHKRSTARAVSALGSLGGMTAGTDALADAKASVTDHWKRLNSRQKKKLVSWMLMLACED